MTPEGAIENYRRQRRPLDLLDAEHGPRAAGDALFFEVPTAGLVVSVSAAGCAPRLVEVPAGRGDRALVATLEASGR